MEPVVFVAAHCGREDTIRTRVRQEHHKPIHTFDLEHGRAVQLVKEIQPYLIGKKRQAELALRLGELRATARVHRTRVTSVSVMKAGRNPGALYRSFGLSDEFIAECEELYQSLRRLNPRFGSGGLGRSA
jgi:hypothetical protein